MKLIRSEAATYQILRQVGEGRSAVVYLAHREDARKFTCQRVALKVLKCETSISALRREFQALSRLDSPHCVRVLGWESLSIGESLVLEWIDGVSLFRLAKSVQFSNSVVDEIVGQIQAGLAELRRCGLYHGDLSPNNILIDRRGIVRLIDFATPPQLAGALIGTPAYLAPEIWRGDAASWHSDLFALGLLEFDLRQGFMVIPAEPSECRKRSEDFARSFPDLLSLAPQARVERNFESTPEKRERLSACVQTYFANEPEAFRTQTIPVEEKRPLSHKFGVLRIASLSRTLPGLRKMRNLAATFGSIALIGGAAVRAEAPPLARVLSGSIRISSNRWLEISLDGRRVGFAPIDLAEIPPGPHKLEWKGLQFHGVKRLKLAEGQHLRLSEFELVGASVP